ncbi:MAG: long-chain fatty acid--CoA ligase [Thermodesulfobacteriota bacterium]|nr:long-chain fatty acid--CoA ligase [Thermodesulfobacteriota bacterium]
MAHYEETSMAAVYLNKAEELGDLASVAYKGPDGQYKDISWKHMSEMIKDMASYLVSRGVKKGDKITLFSENRYEWWVANLAICAVGAIDVPIYATNAPNEAKYIIDNSDSSLCIVGQKQHLDRVIKVRDELPDLGDIIVFDDLEQTPDKVITLKTALKKGNALQDKNMGEIDKRLKSIDPSTMASILYTSGTTGDPKGVMLSHNNYLANCRQLSVVAGELLKDDQTFLSFLPLSHSFERTVGFHWPFANGKKVAFAEDFSKILENFQEVRPTMIVSVPRLYEKIHSGIVSKVSDASGTKKALFNWAMGIARKNLPYICNDRPRTGLFALQYGLADKLIFSKLRVALGMDKLKFALSGGGPLSVSDAEFFLGMGIGVLEGFGLTETTPVTNANVPGAIQAGTIGPAVIDTEEKIGDEGEFLVKGPQIMLGYYKNDAATKEAFTEDGFFRTGDIAEIAPDGYVRITGRLKELIVTSGGKNISPQNIENALKASSFIEQLAIIGDNRKYLSALIVPSFEQLEKWAGENNISFDNHAKLLQNEEVKHLFEEQINTYMQDFARVEQIRKFSLLETEWSQETDEMTPTLKLKRKVINAKYAKEIQEMYPED